MSERDLALMIHVDPSIVPRYQQALGVLASRWEVRPVVAGAFSTAYVQLARGLRRPGGHLLEPLLAHAGAGPRSRWGRVVVISFSAGYALVRELLSSPDADEIAGWIALDSGHAAFEGDRTPLDAHMEPFLRLARRALAGEALLWYGHSDVQTPQKGPQAFASTTQFGLELLRLLKVESTPPETRFVSPRLVVRAYDVRPGDHEEHIAALTEWGPTFTAAALAALDGAEAAAGAEATAEGGAPAGVDQETGV